MNLEVCSTDINIFCNEIEIEQVLVNLISNSIYAVKDLAERWVKIRVTEHQQSIIVKVIDAGHGIPKPVQSEMFRPFYTTKPTGEGTGLGLSISKNIMSKHQGSIHIDTEEGHTCFTLIFTQERINDCPSLTRKSA